MTQNRQTSSKHTNASGTSVNITFSMLLTGLVLWLATLALFFVFGLIVGKGSIPAPQQVALERLQPESEQAAVEESILPQEDLRFLHKLKQEGNAADTAIAELGKAPATPSSPASTAKPQPTQQQSTQQPQENANDVFDFVVRVAAFRGADQADTLRAKLEGAGYRTKLFVDKSAKAPWYYVQILYRGSLDRMKSEQETLKKFGIRDSLITSKKPIK